jgi:hypothetical protein
MNKTVKLRDSVSREYFGEIELIYRDAKTKEIIKTQKEPNLVKIFSKEIISHDITYHKIWDPVGGTGSGAWVENDPFDDFKLKYILLGASFDANGVPLDVNDPRYYQLDPVTGLYVPIKLMPGADYDGGLINAIPIDEVNGRPLKRIENIYFRPTYQPAGTPLLQSDVRAMNNILVVETTLTANEYNGFGLTDSDHFTITEVALSAGIEIAHVAACDIDPRDLFLEGPYGAVASGGDVVTLLSPSNASKLFAGDQIKLVPAGSEAGSGQVSPFYLVLSKMPSGLDITLDRTPTEGSAAITGDVNLYRDTLRIFAHRILESPAKKSKDFEITVRWSIFFT